MQNPYKLYVRKTFEWWILNYYELKIEKLIKEAKITCKFCKRSCHKHCN